MGSFLIDDKRIRTMRQRLGKIAELVPDEYLPKMRNRQIRYSDELAKSYEFAMAGQMPGGKRISNPRGWLLSIWSRANLERTVAVMRRYIEMAKTKLADVARKKRQDNQARRAEQVRNAEGRARLEALKRQKLRRVIGPELTYEPFYDSA